MQRSFAFDMALKKKSPKGPFRLKLPATSANLGPAFDAAALAMDFYLTLEARPAATFSVAATGRVLSLVHDGQLLAERLRLRHLRY